MRKGRLEAFSDGVIAILITIMVLELKVPRGPAIGDLLALLPIFVTYVLSFVFLGIYWNNHHHLLHAASQINGKILWANMHLLFWLSLVPFVTAWLGGNLHSSVPVAAYGVVMLFAGAGFFLLKELIVAADGPSSPIALALGSDTKGKISVVFYLIAIPLAFFLPWLSETIYVGVALVWLVPDRRIEKGLNERKE
jgi:uncharacterized membrane protein